MNRSTVAALVTAAIIGTSGGVVTATVRGNHGTPTTQGPVGSGGSSSPSPSVSASGSLSTAASPIGSPSPATGSATAPAAGPLLYFSPDTIHDGSTVVPFPEATEVNALTRIPGGYLLSEPTSSQSADFDLWTVTTAGKANRIASVSGHWDLNAARTRLVGQNQANGQVTIWDLAAGTPVARWDRSSDATGDAAFAGDQVLVSQAGDSGDDELYQWDPATGATKSAGSGLQQLSVSPGGSYVTGAIDAEGSTAGNAGCLTLRSTYLKKTPVAWQTCDWRDYGVPPQFSPDGTRLVVVPAASDGFGPGQFAIIDASDGPGRLVGKFLPGDWTIGAEWADNDHLYVYGALDGDSTPRSGTFIKRCDFQGHCTDLVRTRKHLVVGGVY